MREFHASFRLISLKDSQHSEHFESKTLGIQNAPATSGNWGIGLLLRIESAGLAACQTGML
jgi:hypothetical protein